MIVTNEDVVYLVTIQDIETDGIIITYIMLDPNEAEKYIQTDEEKNSENLK